MMMESGELLECGLWNGEISGVEVEGRCVFIFTYSINESLVDYLLQYNILAL
jgi:hypothetical protein